ncbi:MAG: electron transfer flavoprotein subunit alpha/FixB family protein, partial [Moraxellaceae bacterium]
MSVLLIAEFDQQLLKGATRSAITAATQLGGSVDVLVIGHNVNAVAQQVSKVQGVSRVLVADDAAYVKPLAENFAPLVQGIAKNYSHIVAAASSFGKNLVPRVAALLDVDMVSEVTKIVDASTYVRPLYAGNLNATVQTTEAIKLLTIRPTGFTAAKDSEQSAPVEVIAAAGDKALSRFISENIQVSERPELGSASV